MTRHKPLEVSCDQTKQGIYRSMKWERKVSVYIPQEKQQCGYLTDSVVAEMRILPCRDANLWRSKIWRISCSTP